MGHVRGLERVAQGSGTVGKLEKIGKSDRLPRIILLELRAVPEDF